MSNKSALLINHQFPKFNAPYKRQQSFYSTFFFLASFILLSSCSFQKKIGVSAKENVLNTPELAAAHVGISIYEPATGRYWYNYQSDKFFTPASNTKIFSCYAGMKYLGDSLTGLLYTESDNDIFILPTGDPSLLHPDYKNQPVISFLQHTKKNIYIAGNNWQENAWGKGWSWDDYNSYYMAERNALPVYGNTIRFVQTKTEGKFDGPGNKPQATIYTEPEINWKLNFNPDTSANSFFVKRNLNENIFTITQGKEKYKELEIPFVTNGISSALELLKDTIGNKIKITSQYPVAHSQFHRIQTQPADSLFKPMMHRSDNFFAEQTLLMVSRRLLGTMNDEKIMDTLLKTDFKDLPQKPNWADGSGLSRFNLFTPQDFVWVLNKMQHEFPWKRLTTIFATGNTGTLTNYYLADSSFIYAKTGTLSGVVAISGYLITKKNKSLVFSVLVNNHQTSGREVRRAVEKFIQSIRDKY
ncbi:MAG: D-alanyl-D-alanine carboxypeptidase/D-alanyl-D-alanine-endopeptidase [Chitinophagaceae bacterium]